MTTYTDILLHDISNNYFIPYGLINRLGDVDISNPTTGQNLTYDGATGKWKNTSTTATVAWGGVTGTLSDQTDLNTALSGKQNSLVSGTNIKTINNTSLLGSGDIRVLQNTARGSNALTINGVASTVPGGINIGASSTADGTGGTAIGWEAGAGASASALGMMAKANGVFSIQLGYGTNSTASTLSVGFNASTASARTNWTLLDGITGLIPDARISTNIARTSDVADTTLSNVSSIDSNSAVQTALDGKVSKSGDTMTGDLSFYRSEISTLSPGEGIAKYIKIYDINDELTGELTAFSHSDGSYGNRIAAINQEYSTWATIEVGIDSNGNNYCTFPNTTCVDGQWVKKSVTVMSGQDLNGSTNLSYTLTDVPNDGYKYEVLLTGQATSGTTAGNAVKLEINSDAITGGTICTAQTRTASTITSSGAVILPLTTSRKIYVLRSTSFHGTGTLYLRGYRRIGTNA